MTIVESDKNFIYVRTDAITGHNLDGTYLKSKDVWRLPHNIGAVRDLISLGYPLEEHLNTLERNFKAFVGNKENGRQYDVDGLRPYQKTDVQHLLMQNNVGVFNQQRTGKTPTVCALIDARKVKTIVVCPASLVLNWQQELSNWTWLDVVVVKGTPKQRQKQYEQFTDVLIISKDTAKEDLEKLLKLDYQQVIVDESHFLRNPKTKQSIALYKLGAKAEYRYALTGTPATNSPSDVFGILKFLRPEVYASYWQFVDRYFKVEDGFWGKRVGDFKNDKRKKEYYELMELISIQRKRKDVMKWLPEKQYQTVRLEMETKQRKHYESMLEMFVAENEETGTEVDASTVLAQLTRLRQITLDPTLLNLDGGSVKLKYLHQFIEDNSGDKIVVFSNFTSFLVKASKEFENCMLITGQQTREQRMEAVNKFQNGNVNLLFCNIEAAGTGLTLDSADVVIFLDRHYTPTMNEQAEDRIVATTQESNQSHSVIDLVCNKSVDEKILNIVKHKESITQIVNNYKSVKEFLT